jgi:DNA-directed RNA polymerase specialized sigma24 family protein
MSSSGSVSHWIGKLKAGDQGAAQPLWECYFHRLVGLARAKLRGSPRQAADEEDVALSALDSFCRGAEQGRFPQLADRHDLWQLLVKITFRKAIDLVKHERRRKRGGSAFQAEPFSNGADDSTAGERGLEQFISREPTPAFAAQMVEQCQRLLGGLSEEQRSIALWKMEGYTNAEIAAKLGCVTTTVERRLRLIRAAWLKERAS